MPAKNDRIKPQLEEHLHLESIIPQQQPSRPGPGKGIEETAFDGNPILRGAKVF